MWALAVTVALPVVMRIAAAVAVVMAVPVAMPVAAAVAVVMAVVQLAQAMPAWGIPVGFSMLWLCMWLWLAVGVAVVVHACGSASPHWHSLCSHPHSHLSLREITGGSQDCCRC